MNKTVLIAHVPYQVRGGEDVHIEQLKDAYTRLGVKTLLLPLDIVSSDKALQKSLYSLIPSPNFPRVEQFYQEKNFDFIHLHNAFPTLGPRFLRWAEVKKIPMMMTLHNHRFFCTNGLAIRKGKNCRSCFRSKLPWRSLVHNCNSSIVKTLYHALAMMEIRCANLLDRSVGLFIAPSRYIEGLILEFGISRKKLAFVLHYMDWNPSIATEKEASYDVIFAGRLSEEKGIKTILETAELLPEIRFAIVGDGPEAETVKLAQSRLANISFFPNRSHEQTLDLIRRSKLGILPSICNEILSLFALEIFMARKLCVVSDSESMRSLAADGFPVRLSKQGDAPAFAEKILQALAEPAISEDEFNSIRNRLSRERFDAQLQSAIVTLLDSRR